MRDVLWPHQIAAIEKSELYISDFRNEVTSKSSLIQIPTGGGKSGIIAILARCIPNVGFTIVLTPRISLRDQLFEDINGRFFNHIGFSTKNLSKKIINVTDGRELTLNEPLDDLVIVMTFQMLTSLFTNKSFFSILTSNISLLLVDEGHYEPAKEWSRITRFFNAPKIIFTATPYRNDFKVFDIDKEYCTIVSLDEAQKDGYIRKVSFVPRSSDVLASPQEFIDDIINFYDSNFPNPGEVPPRVIIRCDDSSSIRHLAQILRMRNKTVVGIHETFTDGDEDWEKKSVPNPEDENAVYWIHQFKLLEGIDDARFQVLAFYEKINNTRSLVQQIGRIIRNPHKIPNAEGFVLEHWNGYHLSMWNGFLNYDKLLANNAHDNFELSTGLGILPNFIQYQPKISYVDGRFRSSFIFDHINPDYDIQLPLRTNIMQKLPAFKMDKFIKAIEDEYIDSDCVYNIYDNALSSVKTILSVKSSCSSYLVNHAFVEADLHLLVIYELNDYLFIYDSKNQSFVGKEDHGIGAAVDVGIIKKLFSDDSGTKITSVALNNSNLGTSVVRSRTLTAVSIEATIPGFDDYAQICTTAEGYAKDEASSFLQSGTVRRYVGFSRGRVTQSSSGFRPLPQYIDWIQKLQEVFESKREPLKVLSRYALERKVPDRPQPRSILLDIDNIADVYALVSDPEQSLVIEDTCIDVIGDSFVVESNKLNFTVRIKYENCKYRLDCPEMENLFFSRNKDYPGNPIKYYNQTQSFRVLPDDHAAIYVRGQFYNPAFKIGKHFNSAKYDLGYCFLTDNYLGRCKSEKGSKSFYDLHDDRWDPSSLFGFISELGATTTISSYFGNPDIIVCDDVGTEVADFILCDSSVPKVVLIHAKASATRHKCSASNLHEVCSQAVKNLGYLAMYNDSIPDKIKSWGTPWKAKVSDGEGLVKNRIVRSSLGYSAMQLWQHMHECINNPHCEKEVWLVLGNILSKSEFERELKKVKPRPHVIQAAYLLHATMTDIASVGAKMRIICDS